MNINPKKKIQEWVPPVSFAGLLLRNVTFPQKKHVIGISLFFVALGCSIGMGLATHTHSSASTQRDCSSNSLDNKDLNGGCGAADAVEYIRDLQQNQPSDLQVLAKNFNPNFHMYPGQYDDFAAHAVAGVVHKDGTVTVDGQLILTNAFSIGRDEKSYASRYSIPNDTTSYWVSKAQDVIQESEIPAIVYFDTTGQAQFVVMKPSGNVVGGTKIKNTVSCKLLNSNQPDAAHKPNTYNFTTTALTAGNSVLSRVVYHFGDDNSTITKTDASGVVEHTFTRDADVTAAVYASVPGGHEIQAPLAANCQKHISFVPAFYVCTNLLATAIDEQKKSFQFTVMAKTDTTGMTSVKDVDFILDNRLIANGVTTKDMRGNVYKEYTFTDELQHVVRANVNFTTVQGIQSATCQASVTAAKAPGCTVPGHTIEAPNSSTCGYCQPGIPIGDMRCAPPVTTTSSNPTTPLINTGPGSAIGLFGVATILGFLGHKFLIGRRPRRGFTSLVLRLLWITDGQIR